MKPTPLPKNLSILSLKQLNHMQNQYIAHAQRLANLGHIFDAGVYEQLAFRIKQHLSGRMEVVS